MRRRQFVQLTSCGLAHLFTAGCSTYSRARDFKVEEATIPEIQAAMESGELSAVTLTKIYLKRIHDLDANGPKINSVIELNPDALEIAAAMDQERKSKGPRGPLHGIPVLLKDNIDTHDRMMTTAGSLALLGSIAPRDATVTTRLRQAGAVILGKANLSEWANFRGYRSTSGWSGRSGQTRNPYFLDRNPSGSSSGSAAAVSANLCSIAIGTETNGSIVSPSSHCGIVGLKPTVGLISRAGIIPISHTQDTSGPMCRTVTDAAIVLGALVGTDPRDEVTKKIPSPVIRDYTKFLDRDGLRGAKIGVARKFFRSNSRSHEILESALDAMRKAGAKIVDPADIPTHGKFSNAEQQVLLYEFKAGLNSYLQSLGPSAPVHSLAEVIAFNRKNAARELTFFGQELLIDAEKKGPLTEQTYLDAVAEGKRLAGKEGIDAIMDQHSLDAIIAPTTGPAGLIDYVYGDRNEGGSSGVAAVAGYPSITLPGGNIFGLPVGISFFGRAWSEPVLFKLAYAFEQRTFHRQIPGFLHNS